MGIFAARSKSRINVTFTPGLLLVRFWFIIAGGKFGQRDNMPQVELVKAPERYFQLLTCQSTQVKNIQFVNDEFVEVYYARGDDSRGDDFIPTSDKTNVVIAAFTTAHARL